MVDSMHIDMGNGNYISSTCANINGVKIALSIPRIGEIVVSSYGTRRRVIEISRQYKDDNTVHADIRTEEP